MSPADTLSAGIAALAPDLPPMATEKLLTYLALLAKWNRTYNLTAIRDEDEMVTHHLLDSLAVLPYLGDIVSIADVGSGAGLPGLVLAIARPELKVFSVEASQKKAAFQQQAKIELGLVNASIVCGRAERPNQVPTVDAAISRAFSDLAEFVRVAGHLVGEGGRLLAMKGVFPAAEISALPAGWRVAANALIVPGLGAQRHLIVLERD